MKDLTNKVAVITGGASGIGFAMAERFAAAGMKIVLADIESDALDTAAEKMRKQGADVLTSLTNVTDAEAVNQLAATTIEHFGGAHLVCNNAGVAAPGRIWELTLEDWEFTLSVNLWGVVYGVRAFAPHLLAQDEGHFVNTASMAGLVSSGNMGAYNVSKQGVVAYSETLFEDLRNVQSNVGVSVLCPAFVQTQIWNSERNRPEALSNQPDAERDAALGAGKEILKAVIENAMPTANVANAVHDAVLDKQLYILTHTATDAQFEERAANILARRNPSPSKATLASLTK